MGIRDYKNTSLVGREYLAKYRKHLHFYVMALRDDTINLTAIKLMRFRFMQLSIRKAISYSPLI